MAKPKRPRDVNQLAKLLVDLTTGEATEAQPGPRAVAGRLGGLKGGKKRMADLSQRERVRLAKKAAAKRWKKTAPPAKGAA